jgi:hypothetical protein
MASDLLSREGGDEGEESRLHFASSSRLLSGAFSGFLEIWSCGCSEEIEITSSDRRERERAGV